jgi:excisionase family DNA binding protein
MSTEVLTTHEAAALLSMHPKTLLEQVREGTVPAARMGRRWKFSRRQLLEWIEAGGRRYEELVDEGLRQATQDAFAEDGEDVPLAEVRARLAG